MAFSTELVLKGGPLAEYITTATAERTGSTSTYSTLASVPVGEGTWLIAVSAAASNTSLSRLWDIWINGDETRVEVAADGNLTNGTVLRHVTTLTGPVTVEVRARWGRLYAGTLHIARIG